MTSAPFPTQPSVDQPTGEQPPAAPGRPPLRRSGTDRMLGGVSGGLADYSGIDTLLWRVGFVALTLAGGSGILVYLLLWVLMPPAPLGPEDRRSPVERFVERLHTAVTGAFTTSRRG